MYGPFSGSESIRKGAEPGTAFFSAFFNPEYLKKLPFIGNTLLTGQLHQCHLHHSIEETQPFWVRSRQPSLHLHHVSALQLQLNLMAYPIRWPEVILLSCSAKITN